MHEKTHENIKTIRPLKDGVIADFQAAEKLIEGLINMIGTKRSFFTHLKMVICIPSGITEVEKRAVFDSADHVDSKETYLIHEPMAAALGIGLDVEEPVGHIIIDIGGGTTEIAVIAMSGIVTDQSIRTAGDEFNYDIMEYMKRAHNILIGERTAEQRGGDQLHRVQLPDPAGDGLPGALPPARLCPADGRQRPVGKPDGRAGSHPPRRGPFRARLRDPAGDQGRRDEVRKDRVGHRLARRDDDLGVRLLPVLGQRRRPGRRGVPQGVLLPHPRGDRGPGEGSGGAPGGTGGAAGARGRPDGARARRAAA